MAEWKYDIAGLRLRLIRVYKSPWVFASGIKRKGQEEWTGRILKSNYIWIRCKRYLLRIYWKSVYVHKWRSQWKRYKPDSA